MDGRGTYVGFCIELCVSSTNKEKIKYFSGLVFLRKYGVYSLCKPVNNLKQLQQGYKRIGKDILWEPQNKLNT